MNDKRLDLLRLILALAVVAGGAMVLMHRMRGGPDADGGQAAERGRTPYQLTWVSPDELQVHGRTMGPIPFKLILFPGEATVDQAERAAADSYAVLDRINRHMSAYLPDSDLSRLNEAPAGRAVTLDGELLALLEAAGDYTARTDGAFDPTARRLFQLWAAAGRTDRLPTEEQIAGALAMTGWRHLALDRPSGTAVKAIDTLQVDLGAIAKGYAVDQVIEAMRSAGMEAGLAEVGGEVRVFGPGPRDGAWLLGITDPFASADSGGRLAAP